MVINYRKTSITFFSITTILFLIVGCGFLPAWLLSNLQTPYLSSAPVYWGKNNAIIVLGAGAEKLPIIHSIKPTSIAYARIAAIAALYLSCKKTGAQCTVIISGGDALATGEAEAVVYQTELLALGVAGADMMLEAHSINTFENAKFTSPILHSQPFDKIFLVTSAIHMKRALLSFSFFGIHPIPKIADYTVSSITLLPKGYNLAVADFAAHEYIGSWNLICRNYLMQQK